MMTKLYVRLPDRIAEIIEEVRKAQHEPNTSTTIRRLIVERLAQLSYLEEESKKALSVSAEEDGDRRES